MDVFTKEWFLENQRYLLFFANTRYGRGVLGVENSSVGKNKIILIIPNAIAWENPDLTLSIEFRTHNKFAKRLFYSYRYLWEFIHWLDMRVANVYIPRLNLGFDTLTAFPASGENSPVDGYVGQTSVSDTFANLRAGSGDDASATVDNTTVPRITASTTTDEFTWIYRAIYLFDTSAIGAGKTISSATLSIYGAGSKTNTLGGAPAFHVVASNPAANNTLANSDYATFSFTSFASKAFSSWDESGYNDYSLNALGIASLNLTGISKFGVIFDWDLNDNFGGSWASGGDLKAPVFFADQIGTANDPKLVINYNLGTVSNGIQSLNNLQNLARL
jgi:hypothetical protein